MSILRSVASTVATPKTVPEYSVVKVQSKGWLTLWETSTPALHQGLGNYETMLIIMKLIH